MSQKSFWDKVTVSFLKLVFHGINCLVKKQREISQTTGAFSRVACRRMRHWLHGPLLLTGSQAWLSDDSQNCNTKCLIQVKCNTSIHQAITWKVTQQIRKSSNQQWWALTRWSVIIAWCMEVLHLPFNSLLVWSRVTSCFAYAWLPKQAPGWSVITSAHGTLCQSWIQ